MGICRPKNPTLAGQPPYYNAICEVGCVSRPGPGGDRPELLILPCSRRKWTSIFSWPLSGQPTLGALPSSQRHRHRCTTAQPLGCPAYLVRVSPGPRLPCCHCSAAMPIGREGGAGYALVMLPWPCPCSCSACPGYLAAAAQHAPSTLSATTSPPAPGPALVRTVSPGPKHRYRGSTFNSPLTDMLGQHPTSKISLCRFVPQGTPGEKYPPPASTLSRNFISKNPTWYRSALGRGRGGVGDGSFGPLAAAQGYPCLPLGATFRGPGGAVSGPESRRFIFPGGGLGAHFRLPVLPAGEFPPPTSEIFLPTDVSAR